MRTFTTLLFVAALGLLSLEACGGDEESDNGGTGGGGKAGAAGDAAAGGAGGSGGSAGKSSGGSAGMPSGGSAGAAGASSCTTIDADVKAFIAANKSCTTAADCVMVSADCWPQQEDCCVIYLNASHDPAAWSALMTTYKACMDAGSCGCCAAIPHDPACNAGTCG